MDWKEDIYVYGKPGIHVLSSIQNILTSCRWMTDRSLEAPGAVAVLICWWKYALLVSSHKYKCLRLKSLERLLFQAPLSFLGQFLSEACGISPERNRMTLSLFSLPGDERPLSDRPFGAFFGGGEGAGLPRQAQLFTSSRPRKRPHKFRQRGSAPRSDHSTSPSGPDPHRPPMLTRNCLLLFLWFLVEESPVCSLHQPPSPLGQSRTGRAHARSSGGPMRNGAAGFQRVKRGWVWNQFFVLEEYMGSDPQYVGKVRKLIFPVVYGMGKVINH